VEIFFKLFDHRKAINIAVAVVVVLMIGWGFAYEPVTRNVLSTDALCTYCHIDREYDPSVRLSMTTPHPATPEGGQARCVDCHLPKGFWPTTFAYTHYMSATDLFGRFRDRDGERAGDWIPMSAARAYRVRDKMFEEDSSTCRTCHIESEIKPKRKRGQRAHAKALKNKETCIECHYNLVHREVEVRDTAFQKPDAKTK
jgi:cytochrome c-type protein NapC